MDDERPDRDDEEPAVLRSGRVRIIGAEPAAKGDERDQEELPPWPVAGGGADAGADADAGTELPHWTEAPTGEVPAVLSRGSEDRGADDPWASVPAPTWREEHADWTAGEEAFEPAMLAEEEARLGSLDDSGESDRQPWSFELHDPDQDTMVVPAVRPLAAEAPEEVPFRFGEEPGAPGAPGEAPRPAGDELVAGSAVPPVEVGGSTTLPRDDAPSSPAPGEAGVDPGEPTDTLPRVRAAAGEPAPVPAPAPPGGITPARAVPPAPEDEPRGRRPVPPAPDPVAARPDRRVPEPPPGPVAPGPLPERDRRNLPVAVASGLVLGVVTLVLFKLGSVPALVVVTGVVTLAAVEVFAAFRRAAYHPATLLGLVATVALLVATYNKGQEALPLVLVLLFVFTMLWHLAGVEPGTEPVRSVASTLLAFCWVGVFGSYAALLLDPTLFPDRHGIAFLLGAIVAGVAYDVGALAVGAWVGRHPLSPASPNKTWEGVVGGAVVAVVVSVVVVHLIHPWTVGAALALGVVVAVVSPIGDLSESLVKRHLGLKDMGRILPGHGGLLDRVDGLLFVLPATYYLVKAFHLG